MSSALSKTIEVIENEPALFSEDTFSPVIEAWLGRHFGHVLDIRPPSYQTNGCWWVMARGWVGQIPMPDGRLFVINPKGPIKNLFAMLAAVYELVPFVFLEGSFAGEELPEFFDFLAQKLVNGTLDRLKRGIYRRYEPQNGRLPVIRGRIDFDKLSRDPVPVNPTTRFSDHTSDNPHNQLLGWTLQQIGTAAFTDPGVAQRARFLARRLPVTLRPFSLEEIDGLIYDRQTRDYESLHRLCRFFLAQIGPSHAAGLRKLTPFLISMPVLFEHYVAHWLRDHLPSGWRLVQQAQIGLRLDRGSPRRLAADIVVVDPTGRTAAVLDTKYKNEREPAMSDIYQVTFYAHELDCNQAVLIYPFGDAGEAVAGRNRGVRYQSIIFDISSDLSAAGAPLLNLLGF